VISHVACLCQFLAGLQYVLQCQCTARQGGGEKAQIDKVVMTLPPPLN
jgi:hypothetical protein